MNLLPAFVGEPERDRVYNVDALTLLRAMPDNSVDAIVTDMPYGTTACSWDTPVPFDGWWQAVKHALKPRGVMVTTASQPFTSALVMSNPKWFRCEWIARKPAGTGYLNANRQPMKNHENVLVFAAGEHGYTPQMRSGKPYRATSGAVGGFVRDKTVGGYLTVNDGERYPLSVIDFKWEQGLHPTQKPVALFDYLIRTYTQAGALVVDPFAGSGTTLIAARNLNRRYIGGDITPEYVDIARQRLSEPYTPNMFDWIDGEQSA